MNRPRPSTTVSRVLRTSLGTLVLGLSMVGCAGGEADAPCDVPKLFVTKNCAIAGCHSTAAPAGNFDMTVAGWETEPERSRASTTNR